MASNLECKAVKIGQPRLIWILRRRPELQRHIPGGYLVDKLGGPVREHLVWLIDILRLAVGRWWCRHNDTSVIWCGDGSGIASIVAPGKAEIVEKVFPEKRCAYWSSSIILIIYTGKVAG